ncbi:MAG TPA: hypothetical protein VK250_01870 [Nitrososphaeraceae archaeon]|nr:hypothetical protein [Nitrososphaeraceae archaeon]
MLDKPSPVDIPNTSWCPRCLEVGIYVQLIPRLYKKEELINGELPHDCYDWLQCHDCGRIVQDLI